MLQQGLRAVVTRADVHAVAGENLADVVRVDAVNGEGQDAAVLLGLLRAENVDVRHAAQLLERAGRERDLAAVDRVEADAADIVDRGVQPGGVVLCILAVVPLMLGVGLASSDVAALLVRVAPADVYAAAAVDALLLLVACGVGVLVWSGTYTGAMDQLLEEGDYTRKKKARSGVMSTVSLIYWLSVTAIFLFYTFGPRGNGQPQYSWFIWAVGGVLYAAVMGIVSLVLYHKDKM